MAYKIGQLRKEENGNYMTNLTDDIQSPSFGQVKKEYPYMNNQTFDQLSIWNSNSFSPNEVYFIRFRIQRLRDQYSTDVSGFENANDLGLQVFLYKSPNRSFTITQASIEGKETLTNQMIDSFTVGHKREDNNLVNGDYEYRTLVFKPQFQCTTIVFILSRQAYDFLVAPRFYNFQLLELSTIENILPKTANKIGVQSRPGTLIMVNQQPVRIGRSGTYEVNNGVQITSFGISAPQGYNAENIDHFILDYTYNEE